VEGPSGVNQLKSSSEQRRANLRQYSSLPLLVANKEYKEIYFTTRSEALKEIMALKFFFSFHLCQFLKALFGKIFRGSVPFKRNSRKDRYCVQCSNLGQIRSKCLSVRIYQEFCHEEGSTKLSSSFILFI
jgi:hypothetical protein